MSDNYSLAPVQQNTALSVFGNVQHFETAQRMAKALSSSDLMPEAYRGDGKMGNCLIAMEVAARTGASILAVAQNLHIIEGRPSWSSQYVIAALNSCGRFAPMRFDMQDAGEKDVQYEFWDGPKGSRTKKTGTIRIHNKTCTAWTVPAGVQLQPNIRTLQQARDANAPIIEGPRVSIEMAVAEGWYTKNGSKWRTMPDLMLQYRSAKFFGNLHAPDVLMGMHSRDEIEDMQVIEKDITPPLATPARTDLPKSPEVALMEGEIVQATEQPPAQPEKRRGRPPKSDAPPVQSTPPRQADTDTQDDIEELTRPLPKQTAEPQPPPVAVPIEHQAASQPPAAPPPAPAPAAQPKPAAKPLEDLF